MSICDITLRRAARRRRQVLGGLTTSLQDAVGAKANPVIVLVGLKVDVRGALLDGVDQHLVDEAHDGCFVHAIAAVLALGPVLHGTDIDTVEIGAVRGPSRPSVRVSWASTHSLMHPAEGAFLQQDGVGIDAGVELDFVQGRQVGGIGNGDKQAIAAAVER